jgi:glycyl-tRNA synthetase
MSIDKIIDIAKKRGFIFQSAEIYGGLSGLFDYGPVGTIMKNKIENFWREFFLKENNIFEISSRTIVPEVVWQATGHLKEFVDPITQCQSCKSMFRADNLIEEATGKFVEGAKADELAKIIKEEKIKCPKCKGTLGEVRIFNLMLKTNVGPVEGVNAYLRPETAQGIFTNFKSILNSTRAKLPFGVAQLGISYRNEISPRQWLVRLREFSQMEIEFFFNPKNPEYPKFSEISYKKLNVITREEQKKKCNSEEKKCKAAEFSAEDLIKRQIVPNQWMVYFMVKELEWYRQLGMPAEALRHRHMLPEETPHYSKGNFDMEIKFDFGWKEVVGNAYRADFDLQTHMKHSGKDLAVIEDGEKVVPHVIEPSFGLDRTFYAILLYCFVEDKKRGWDWFRFPAKISPFVAAVYPLVSKDGLAEKAKEVFNSLKGSFDVFFDMSGSIGKRYARADEIGTNYCITVDYQTLKDKTVTVRDRDSAKQIRVEIKKLPEIICKLTCQEIEFEKAGKTIKG